MHEKVVTQPPEVVTQKNTAVANDEVSAASDALRWHETELRREPSHYERKIPHGPVTARIHRKLRNARAAIGKMSVVNPDAGERFVKYILETIGPLLVSKGAPFTDLDEIVNDLRSKYQPVTA